MILICGPCVIESFDKLNTDAKYISEMIKNLGIDLYFKASCIKDNRTNLKNYRGPGFSIGIEYLLKLKSEYGMKITTDFHTIDQIQKYGQYVDLIQIPAFLAMQTSLINAAIETKKPIHIKKPQWLPPFDVQKPISKIKDQDEKIEVMITDRGTTFGYNNVIMDPRHIRKMKETSQCDKVIVDITHPQNHSEIYDRTYAFDLGISAIACGADGLFIESTFDPESAKCDGDSMIPINMLEEYLRITSNLYNYIRK